jgi:Holliday junction resolvase RusA-like endonuclease
VNRLLINAIFPGRPEALQRARGTTRWSRKKNRSFVQTYTPKESQKAKKTLAWQLKAACPGLRCDGESRFGIQVEFRTDKPKMADGDNFEKLLLDAFTGVIWNDDEQVDEMQWKRVRGALVPSTHFVCYKIEGEKP